MYPTVRFSGMCWYVQLNHFYLLSTTQVLLLGVGCKTSYDMVSIELSSLVYLPYILTSPHHAHSDSTTWDHLFSLTFH